MNTAKLALVIGTCSIGLFASGCASDVESHELRQKASGLVVYDEKTGEKYEIPDDVKEESDAAQERGGGGGDPDECTTTALPELVELVNFMLSNDPAMGPALVMGSSGGVEVAHGTSVQEDALKITREAYVAETGNPEDSFTKGMLVLQDLLVNTAVPAITDTTCGVEYPYFAVPFAPGDPMLHDLNWFFKRSQHKYLAPMPCPPQYIQENGLKRDAVCAFVDPTWSSKGSDGRLSVQRYSNAIGNAWIPTSSVAVTADPYTSIDPSTGFTTVTFTAYRAYGDPGTFSMKDTSAVRVTYGTTDMGVWQADVTSVPSSTGSKAVLRLQTKIGY